MKVVEIKSVDNVCCPFCDQVVLVNDGESEPKECPHTLLIATDMGIEFCSDSLDAESLEEQADESSWDDVVSKIDNPKAVLIKLYEGAPGFLGAYYLFAK